MFGICIMAAKFPWAENTITAQPGQQGHAALSISGSLSSGVQLFGLLHVQLLVLRNEFRTNMGSRETSVVFQKMQHSPDGTKRTRHKKHRQNAATVPAN
jgi:hypothetical protein